MIIYLIYIVYYTYIINQNNDFETKANKAFLLI